MKSHDVGGLLAAVFGDGLGTIFLYLLLG